MTSGPLEITGAIGGFYMLHYFSSTAYSLTARFNTDPYQCPFPSTYNDIHQVFKGCSFGDGSGNIHAAEAVTAHQCGNRLWWNGISCLPVDENCNTYDTRTG